MHIINALRIPPASAAVAATCARLPASPDLLGGWRVLLPSLFPYRTPLLVFCPMRLRVFCVIKPAPACVDPDRPYFRLRDGQCHLQGELDAAAAGRGRGGTPRETRQLLALSKHLLWPTFFDFST